MVSMQGRKPKSESHLICKEKKAKKLRKCRISRGKTKKPRHRQDYLEWTHTGSLWAEDRKNGNSVIPSRSQERVWVHWGTSQIHYELSWFWDKSLILEKTHAGKGSWSSKSLQEDLSTYLRNDPDRETVGLQQGNEGRDCVFCFYLRSFFYKRITVLSFIFQLIQQRLKNRTQVWIGGSTLTNYAVLSKCWKLVTYTAK